MSGVTYRVGFCDDGEAYLTLPSALAAEIDTGEIPRDATEVIVAHLLRGVATCAVSMVLAGDTAGLHDLRAAIADQAVLSLARLTKALEP